MMKERNTEQTIQAIQTWLHNSIAYLSNREGYPRGYRNGLFQAKEIIADILRENGIDETYPD